MTTCANYPLENACSRRGAQMGRCDFLPENPNETVKYDGITEVFVRATSREDAKKNILLKMPGARFYR